MKYVWSVYYYVTKCIYWPYLLYVIILSDELNCPNTTLIILKHSYPAWLCLLSGWCTCELQLELSLEPCTSDTSEGQRWCSRLHLEFWWSCLLLTEMTWLICWCDFDISVQLNGLQYSYSSRSHCHRQPHSSPQHSLHNWATHTCLVQSQHDSGSLATH